MWIGLKSARYHWNHSHLLKPPFKQSPTQSPRALWSVGSCVKSVGNWCMGTYIVPTLLEFIVAKLITKSTTIWPKRPKTVDTRLLFRVRVKYPGYKIVWVQKCLDLCGRGLVQLNSSNELIPVGRELKISSLNKFRRALYCNLKASIPPKGCKSEAITRNRPFPSSPRASVSKQG